MGAETGWRFKLDEHFDVTPRVWLVRPSVSVDPFTDAVNSRVSVQDAERLITGIGLVADSSHLLGDGEISLRGALDVEHIFSGEETVTLVSGEELIAESSKTGMLARLGGSYRQDSFSIGVGARATAALDADTRSLSGYLTFEVLF